MKPGLLSKKAINNRIEYKVMVKITASALEMLENVSEPLHARRSGWEKIISTMGIGVRSAGSVLAKAGPRRAF
jgi:hypothetical protein